MGRYCEGCSNYIGNCRPYGKVWKRYTQCHLFFPYATFFLLSGYTYHIVNDREAFIRHLKKDSKHLILPCLIVSAISIIASWYQGNIYDATSFWQITKSKGDALWWASGIIVNGHPGIGPIWFLFSLFWAKFLLNALHLLFPGKYIGGVYVFLGLAGIALGIKGKWLPQNMDVTFVAILFIYLGMLWRKYHEFVEEHADILFLMAISFWSFCLCFDQYIEMAGRHYPYIALSVIEAVCGSFAVCWLCKALAQNVFVKNITLFIGIHTLLIFLVHDLDIIVAPLWQTSSYWLTCITRVLIVLSISFLLHTFRYCWKSMKSV